jgi:hypothetical protein
MDEIRSSRSRGREKMRGADKVPFRFLGTVGFSPRRQGGLWGGFDEYTEELREIDTKELHARADEVRAQHSELLKDY